MVTICIIGGALAIHLIAAIIVLFRTEDKYNGLRKYFVDQQLVDQKLSKLAATYHAMGLVEIAHQQHPGDNPEDSLERARVAVQQAKAEFWKAWHIAKKCHYDVRSSFRDYLALEVEAEQG